MQNAILLHAPLPAGDAPPWAGRLLEAMPYARRLRLERVDAAARVASLGGCALALAGAGQLLDAAACSVRDFRFEADRKPRFARGPYFSLSHSDRRVACIACTAHDVGLDIETLHAATDASSRSTLLRWTAAEATLKAAGLGIRHVHEVGVDLESGTAELEGRRYVLRALTLAEDTLGHVAAHAPLDLLIAAVTLDGAEVSTAVERALGLATQ